MGHAVIAYFLLASAPSESAKNDILLKMEDRLIAAINENGVGEFDGIERGRGAYIMYMYGPNADQLFAVVEPILKSEQVARGSFVIKRYGSTEDENAREVRVPL